MKSVIYTFDPVIYPWPLLVTKKFDAQELDKLFYVYDRKYELFEPKDEFHLSDAVIARTVEVHSRETNQIGIIILLNKPKEIGNGVIAHEAYHAANMIAARLGFSPENITEDDEPCAYLLQWIANCVASVLEGKPKVMNGVRV